MDFSAEYDRRRDRVDTWLDRLMPAATTRPAVLHEAMRYSVMAGGKRLRPLLALGVAEAFGADPEPLAKPACALELFHTYTLIHDDLPCMDDDDLRRGLPTCHIRFGEANALLAGDALLTLAFEWLAGAPRPAECVRELAECGGSQGVVGGQVEDLAAESRAPDEETLRYIHLNKTARLLRASLRIGGFCSGCTPAELEGLGRFGDNLGLAFQIVDDILDETATTEQLGKPAGSDRANAKMTYVTLRGIDGARAEAARLHEAALRELAELGRADTAFLSALTRALLERAR